MNKKTIYILVAVLVVILVVGVAGVYILMNQGAGGANEETVNVADASSLQYNVDVTSQGTTATYKYAAKGMGTSDLMLRIDIAGGEAGDWVYILNGAEQKAWAYADGEWSEISDAFATQWDAWNPLLEGYVDNLTQWSGTGEWTYTAGTEDIRIYNIEVNPTLADSVFQAS